MPNPVSENRATVDAILLISGALELCEGEQVRVAEETKLPYRHVLFTQR